MLPVSYTAGSVLLLPLLVQALKTVRDSHSLCLDLTVTSQSRPGHRCYEVQGSVDKKFLQYDSDNNNFRPLGLLARKANATKAWTKLTETLEEVGMILPDIKLENSMTRGPPSLDNQLCCQHEAERCPTVSWHFNINGQAALLFDTMSMTWTVVNPGARGIKEEWEDKGLSDYFRRISMGDCNHWLGAYLEHWEKVLEPPAASVNVSEPKSSSIWETPRIVLAIFISSVWIFFGIFMNCGRGQSLTWQSDMWELTYL
uniref:Retinoic acid early-inducible protein 1 domain-containing protein n=1 Tax=Mustela putorius furo TaxID=9669 RepID=M3YG20_MUSPF